MIFSPTVINLVIISLGFPEPSTGNVKVRAEHLPQQAEGAHCKQVGRQEQERNLPHKSIPGSYVVNICDNNITSMLT